MTKAQGERHEVRESRDPASTLIAQHVKPASGQATVYLHCSPEAVTHGTDAKLRTFFVHRSVAVVSMARAAFSEIPGIEVIPGHGACGAHRIGAVDVVAIRIPREKIALLQLLWDAFHMLREGGLCWIAGANNEGAKTAAKLLADLFGNAEVAGRERGHRIVSAVKQSSVPANSAGFDSPFLACDAFNQITATLRGREITLYTRPGVFSWDHIDEATTLLAEVMDIKTGEHVLDLGCGAGALGILAATLNGGAPVHMVDADVEAVRSASRSVAAARLINARVLPSDVASAVINEKFDVVITNPPFHTGRATDLELPARFIHDAFTVLKPGGRLYLVANRTLPYEREIRALFGNNTAIAEEPRFKVIRAVKPI